MRRSRRTFNERIVELSQTPVQPNICARCNYVFDYPEGTPRSEAFQLVCEHWKTYLAEISGESVGSPEEEVIETDRESPSPAAVSDNTLPPVAKRARTASQSSAGPSRGRKKNVMDKGARRQLIESDSWVKNATSKSVDCKGCGRTIKLDKRSDYYPGLWHKHRNKCFAIRRLGHTGKQPKKATEAAAVEGNTRFSMMTKIITPSTKLLAMRSTSPDDKHNSYTIVTHARSLRPVGAKNIRKDTPQEDPEIVSSNNIECSDEEDYWGAAPFGPDKVSVDSSESASKWRSYRYSTRRELVTRYKSAPFQHGKVSEPCSDEVMQAARYLVSMKCRTSV